MNHIYRVVYNHHTNTYQAVPEISNGAHTSCSNSGSTLSLLTRSDVLFSRAALSTLALAVTALGTQRAHAAPTGGQVSAGQATIQQNGKVTDIHQTSQKAAINWQKFGIKADETVNFKQPNAQSVTLNRVIGNEKSVIDGAMKANGKVFITNPNGVMIGNGAKINVGALLATTGKISDNDFMAGNYRFQDAKGAVENYGEITVPEGGAVALIAPVVRNQGTIKAPQGNALLASAEQFSVTLQDDSFAYTLDKGTLQGLVDNGGAIYADAGHIVLTAKGVDMVKKSLIKHSGIAEANTVRSKNGVIELLGDLDNTRLEVNGTLKAEAKEQGDGGFIETSAAEVKIKETVNVSTKATNGKTGTWLIDPTDFIVTPDGDNDSSGSTISGSTLSGALKQNDMTIRAMSDTSRNDKGDVIINDDITWNANKLTLNAHNNIYINKTINGSGTASLALEYGQGTSTGISSDYFFEKDIPISPYLLRTVQINLPEGKNLSIKRGSDGTVEQFDVIHKMPDIQNDGTAKFNTKNIAIGADLNLSQTKSYTNFSGYELPDGTKIHGLGHNINDILMLLDVDAGNSNIPNQSDNYKEFGLFKKLTNGEIKDLSAIKSIYLQSFITSGVPRGTQYAGGLVGRLENSTIKNVAFGGIIDAMYSTTSVGGLAGYSENSKILNSHTANNVLAKGDVSFHSDYLLTSSKAGGLVGTAKNTTINHSSSQASITASTTTSAYPSFGGGYETSSDFYSNAGGLVGEGSGVTIKNSYFDGDVSSLGGSHTQIKTKSPSSSLIAGGLIGIASSRNSVENSYAKSTLTTHTDNSGDIKQIRGGIVGNINDSQTTFTNVYYDKDLASVTNVDDHSFGKSTAEMKKQATFQNWDFSNVWYIDENSNYPKLMFKELTESEKIRLIAKVRDRINRYNGNNWQSSSVIDFSGFVDGDDAKSLSGVIKWGGTATNAINAGDYSIIASGLYSDKYDIEFQSGKLTVLPKIIDISAKKSYDGNAVFTKGFLVTNAIGSDVVNITGNATVSGKDVGSYNKFLTANLISSNPNYAFSLQDSKVEAVIDKAKLSAITKTAMQGKREYDGTANAYAQDITKLMGKQNNDDVFVASGIGVLNHKNVGARYLTSLGSLVLGGKDAKNYELTTDDSVWIITPAKLEIAAQPDTKVYDGTTTSNLKPNVFGLKDGDSVTATQEFESPEVTKSGYATLLILKNYQVHDGNNGLNYIVNRGITSKYENSAIGRIKDPDTVPTTPTTPVVPTTPSTPVTPTTPTVPTTQPQQPIVDNHIPVLPIPNKQSDVDNGDSPVNTDYNYSDCFDNHTCRELFYSFGSHISVSNAMYFSKLFDDYLNSLLLDDSPIAKMIGVSGNPALQTELRYKVLQNFKNRGFNYKELTQETFKKMLGDVGKIVVGDLLNRLFNLDPQTENPKDKVFLIFTKAIADIAVDSASDLAEGKNFKDIIASRTNSVLDATKDSIKLALSLDPEHSVLDSVGDFILDIAMEMGKSFIGAVIEYGPSSPATFAKFKKDFFIQLSLASAKQVIKTGTVWFQASEMIKNNIIKQADNIIGLAELENLQKLHESQGNFTKSQQLQKQIEDINNMTNGIANQMGLSQQEASKIDFHLRQALLLKSSGNIKGYKEKVQFIKDMVSDSPLNFGVENIVSGIYSLNDYAHIMIRQLGLDK